MIDIILSTITVFLSILVYILYRKLKKIEQQFDKLQREVNFIYRVNDDFDPENVGTYTYKDSL